ncbi:hypothetical protein KC19_1G033400 [Ceratodon purpureus]|uniref:Peroxidase n=1 Tax=Ceratodon purpureus TaxID=3225 RepID=A0A8T0J3W4_CERPU|nr:hypothetical protein KC19_1G033400 [Ceratodon purpureus]
MAVRSAARGTMLAFAAVVAALVLWTSAGVEATLTYDFYSSSCPHVEYLVYQEISKAYWNDSTVAPGILRLSFHDCFVNGCDASVLVAGNTTERAAIQNAGIHGFEAINAAKWAVEQMCPGVVSCADILQYAARDTVKLTKGLGWGVPAGRRDGTVSLATDPPLNLPPATFNSSALVANFAAKGLSAEQMVILSGSHTIGVTHCLQLRDRIFDVIDPTMPKDLLATLQAACPTNTTPTALTIDRSTVDTFDTNYFSNIASGYGLMTSDQTLFADPATRPYVEANLQQGAFDSNFAAAMVAMSSISPKVGTDGEIRHHCEYFNG